MDLFLPKTSSGDWRAILNFQVKESWNNLNYGKISANDYRFLPKFCVKNIKVTLSMEKSHTMTIRQI